MVGAYQYAKVYTYNNTVVPGAVGAITPFGIQISLPAMIYIDSIPYGSAYTFEISLDSSVWSDTTQFPCRQSAFEPGVPACDYFIHGWQTVPGFPHVILNNTINNQIPLCCPEGVVQFCSSQIGGTCNPRPSSTPWRMLYNSEVTTPTQSSVLFDMELVAVANPSPAMPLCNTTDVSQIQLWVNPDVVATLSSVVVAGQDAGFSVYPATYPTDPAQYITITAGLAYNAGSAQVMLQFASQVRELIRGWINDRLS